MDMILAGPVTPPVTLPLRHLSDSVHAGSQTVNVLPLPSSLRTSIRPPCLRTMWRHMAKPSPTPETFALRAAAPR